jgi:beta-lactamase class A
MPSRNTFRVGRSNTSRRIQKRSWRKARTLARTSYRRSFSSSLPLIILVLLLVGSLAFLAGPFSQSSKIPTSGASGPTAKVLTVTASPVAGAFATLTLTAAAAPETNSNEAATLTPVPPTPTPAPASLQEAINRVIDKDKDSLGADAGYGMVIHNLDTGEKFEVNPNELFESASLYKIFVALSVYYDMAGGRLSPDDQITLIPDADAHDEDGYTIVAVGDSLPVSTLLEKMIVDSNNTAGLMLLFQVRAARMAQIAADLGFTGSDFSDTYNFRVTPADLDLYFSRLADLKLMGAKYDQPLIDLMSKSLPRDRIPAMLPEGTHVANKTGNLTGIINDAGIIWLPNGNRLIVSVLTHHVDEDAARQFIAELSLAAYNYYNKGQN